MFACGRSAAVWQGWLHCDAKYRVPFVLGVFRVVWVVPQLGERTAELIEMPLMLAASYFAACFITQRFKASRRVEYLYSDRRRTGPGPCRRYGLRVFFIDSFIRTLVSSLCCGRRRHLFATRLSLLDPRCRDGPCLVSTSRSSPISMLSSYPRIRPTSG